MTFHLLFYAKEVIKLNVLNAVGNTPLFELKKINPRSETVRIFAKGEFLNVSGSVKDRAAKAMLLDGIKTGKLTKDKTIIDATSGNTGIAYAMAGAALGYKVKLCMPSNVTVERQKIIKAYGAEIVLTDPLEGIEGAYNECRSLVSEDTDKYFYPDQYGNEQNWKAHYLGTSLEILRQTDGRLTHFVAGTGTSGTFMGCTKRFKEFNPDIQCIMMVPDLPFHGIEGIKHYSILFDTGFFDMNAADSTIEISTDTAYKTTRRLSREEGLHVGISSGANVAAALKAAESAPDGSVIITILCDCGSRYPLESAWGDIE